MKYQKAVIGWFFFASSAHAWLYYSKPEFRGRIIDAETKESIEGAVVVVSYNKWNFGGPGGGNTLPFDAKEMLTDKNGEFYFPSYTTLIGPLSKVRHAEFIIFKPGYMSSNLGIKGTNIPDEEYFAIEKDMLGKEGVITYINPHFADLDPITWKGLMGVVELRTVSSDRAMPPNGIPTRYGACQLPLLYKAINEDRRNRGLKGKVE